MNRTEETENERGARPGTIGVPVRLGQRVFVSFLPSSMPLLSRMNYRRELTAAFFFPLILAAVEGGVAGVIARTYFDGVVDQTLLNYVVAALVAAPAFANVVSFIWARLAHGVDKIRFINALQLGMVLSVALIAATPRTAAGLWMFLGLAFSTRMCYAGVITLRSSIWGVNYPKGARARVAGKLTTVQVITVALVGWGMGLAMEAWAGSFRVMFPLGASIALIGVLSWSRIRVRGRRRLLRAERADARGEGPSFNPIAMVRILRADKDFDRYMSAQMLLGIGNMMTWAPVVIMIKEIFDIGYSGVLITHTLPLLIMPLSIPIWARVLDRNHVIYFRAIHSWFFVASTLCIFIGGVTVSLPFVIAGVAIKGIAFGGGALAWNLGHLDFAPEDKASQYMAVHVTLTGLRGLAAPFLGVTLYELFGILTPSGEPIAFAVASVIVTLGAVGFVDMHRRRRQRPLDADTPGTNPPQ